MAANDDASLSAAERNYILGGADENFRTDGRSKSDFREILVDVDILPNASGSSSVRIGASEVLVSVKAEIGEPSPLHKDVGAVTISVGCSSNAYHSLKHSTTESLSLELSSALSNQITSRTLDLRSLCILPGEQCWVLHVDALILQCDGNLEDVLSIALKAALYDTKIPKLTLAQDDDGRGTFEVSDDPCEVTRLDVMLLPLLLTFNLLNDQFVVDATVAEELCSDVKVVAAVDKDGRMCSLQKCGNRGVNPELMERSVFGARKIGIALNSTLMQLLQSSA